MSAALPTITIEFDGEEHVLMARSYGQTTPAGERLFRAEPWPDIQWKHDSKAAAEKDAATLREYLARVWPVKTSRAKIREAHD